MDNIFEIWKERERHKGEFFYRDGAINKDLWKDPKNYKILFILKEAYQEEETTGDRDLCERIFTNKASRRTFIPLGQWAYGIKNVIKEGHIKDFKKKGLEVNNALFSSAIINIKKSGGNKKSNPNNLKIYVKEDWDLINKQIKLLNPDLIVCGNTWDIFKSKLKKPINISERVFSAEGNIFVNFWHPSNRASKLMNYYALCSLVLKSLSYKEI